MRTFIENFGRVAAGALMFSALIPRARADDLTTLAGATYHDVRMVRVEPDGIVWDHATGMCKVDFTDLPETIRRKYHFDPKQAAAWRAAQAEARQKAAAQSQQDQATVAAWHERQGQQIAATANADSSSGTFALHHGAADELAEKSVKEQIEAKKNALSLLTKDDGTVWDRRLWVVPCLIIGGGYDPGVKFDPHVDLRPQEYQSSLHGMASDIFTPMYLTKSYNDELDRVEAFARGRP